MASLGKRRNHKMPLLEARKQKLGSSPGQRRFRKFSEPERSETAYESPSEPNIWAALHILYQMHLAPGFWLPHLGAPAPSAKDSDLQLRWKVAREICPGSINQLPIVYYMFLISIVECMSHKKHFIDLPGEPRCTAMVAAGKCIRDWLIGAQSMPLEILGNVRVSPFG